VRSKRRDPPGGPSESASRSAARAAGMRTAERLFERQPLDASDLDLADPALAEIARGATYFAPFDEALARVGLPRPATLLRSHVLTACSASTLAIGLGKRWLERGACDVAIVGGYDAVSVFVAAGFEALRATTASHPRPFRVGRDGMSLGEGAGILVLVREPGPAPVLFRIAGFGASTDAVHITAPDRTGGGLARAARAALDDAAWGAEHIDLVSAHATATPFNDPMEARALREVLGAVDLEQWPVVQPLKAQIGHTLGAAGVLETMAAAAALGASGRPCRSWRRGARSGRARASPRAGRADAALGWPQAVGCLRRRERGARALGGAERSAPACSAARVRRGRGVGRLVGSRRARRGDGDRPRPTGAPRCHRAARGLRGRQARGRARA
jgi:hypothetical protein